MSGTDDQILANFQAEDNQGDSVCTPDSMAQVEVRLQAYVTTAAGGGAANHLDNRRRFMIQLFIFAANVGTGSREYWAGKSINWHDRLGGARIAEAGPTWDHIVGNPAGTGGMTAPFPKTVKAYLRSRATLCLKLFKAQPTQLVRSTRMGLPENYRYLAADWFDGAHGISPAEQGAIDCAKQVALFRSARANALNVSSHYTAGEMNGQAGHIQANAGTMTLRQ